jgi:superfamily II DNA or RNA helicase
MSAPQFRDYQIDVVRHEESGIAPGWRRLWLVAPTGSGKTVIAAALIAKAADRSESVLFTAHRRALIQQSSRPSAALGRIAGLNATMRATLGVASLCQHSKRSWRRRSIRRSGSWGRW